MANNKMIAPIKPRTSAICELARSIWRTNRPMLPKMSMAVIVFKVAGKTITPYELLNTIISFLLVKVVYKNG